MPPLRLIPWSVPTPCRGGVLAVLLVAVALLAAACGGGRNSRSPGVASIGSADAGSSSSSGSAAASGVDYARCMRSHGVPDFPDPNANGKPLQVDAQQLGVSDSLYLAAETACQYLLPTSGSLQQLTHQCLLFGDCPQSLVRQLLTVERKYAQCLRSHGVPNWPDPTISPKGGRPVFDLSGAGIDPQSTDSSQFRSKDLECRRLVGGSVPSLPTT
jgi:hypothetical protein